MALPAVFPQIIFQRSLDEAGGGDIRRIFRLHHRLVDALGQNRQPDAQPRHQNLGKALDVNDTVFVIQRLQGHDILFAIMEIAEVILFDDVSIIFFRQFQQPPLFLHGIGNARGGLEISHHINEFRLIQLQEVLQDGHIHAVRFHGHLHQLCPPGKEGPRRAVKGGLFHKNHIPIAEHGLGNDIDALLGAGDDLHIFHAGLDAVAFQIAAKLLSQGCIAHAVHIAEGAALFPVQHLVEGLFEGIHGEHFMGQGGAGKIDGIFHGEVPSKGAEVAVCHRLRNMLHRQGGNKGAAAHPGIDHLLLLQIFIGIHDGNGIDPKLLCHFPNGRQLAVGRQKPIQNQGHDAFRKLLVKRGLFFFLQLYLKNPFHIIYTPNR